MPATYKTKIISQLYPLLRTLQTLLIPIFEILSLHIIELRLNGGTVSKIYINGRELHDRTELSSLQATDIENVEILPEADLQYNATTKGGIIYILEKKCRWRRQWFTLFARRNEKKK